MAKQTPAQQAAAAVMSRQAVNSETGPRKVTTVSDRKTFTRVNVDMSPAELDAMQSKIHALQAATKDYKISQMAFLRFLVDQADPAKLAKDWRRGG